MARSRPQCNQTAPCAKALNGVSKNAVESIEEDCDVDAFLDTGRTAEKPDSLPDLRGVVMLLDQDPGIR
jgi:hypothetical protein